MARKVEIIITADDRASGTFNKASQSVGGFGSSLGGALAVATGQLMANAISSIGRFMSGIIDNAAEAIGNAQTLEIALEGLLTQSLMYEQVNEVRQEAISLTEEEAAKLLKLQASLDTQNAKIQEQQERIRQMAEEWTDAGLNVQIAKAKLAEMELKAQETADTIAELTAKEGEFSTTTETSWQQVRSFAEASGLAAEQAQGLLRYISQLAVISPFETAQVEQVARIGLAAGLSAEQVKDFSAAFLDYAAVQGITSANLAFAADQFLQLRKVGKLTEIDLRQLRRLGIDVSKVLGIEMGMSVAEFNEQVGESPELMDELIESFIHFAGETSAGASQRMATTITGMMSTVTDIIEIGSRNLFRPIVEAVSPFAAELLSTIADFVTGEKIAEIGQKMADDFSAIFSSIVETVKTLFDAYEEGGVSGLLVALGFTPQAIALIDTTRQAIGEVIDFASEMVAEFKEGGVAGLGQAIASDLQAAWPSIQAQLTAWGLMFWDWIQDTALPLAQEKLAGIAGEVSAAWPSIQAVLMEWGRQFWEWVTTVAIPQARTKLDELAAVITDWSEAPETQAQAVAMGETLGRGLVDGTVAVMSGTYMTLKAGDALKGLPDALAEAIAGLGTSIAQGIINGIADKLNVNLGEGISKALEFIGIEGADELGRKLAAALAEGFRAGLETAMSLINPVAFIRGQVGTVQESVQQAAGLFGGEEGGGFRPFAQIGQLFGPQESTTAATQFTTGLNEAMPQAILDSGLGSQFMRSVADDMAANEDAKKQVAQSIVTGLPAYVAAEAGRTGEAFLESVTTYVMQRLGMGTGQVRP